MRQNHNPAADIALMNDVLDFIKEKDDAPANCEQLKKKLAKLGDGVTNILDFRFGNEILRINLAGYIFNQLPFKKNFLNCILELAPQLLLQNSFNSELRAGVKSVNGIDLPDGAQFTGAIIPVTSPLIVAIRNRQPEMVAAILNHQIFLDDRKDNVAINCLRLIDSYCCAIRWYHSTNTEAEAEILEMLFASASESMQEAGKQNRLDLLEDLTKEFSTHLFIAALQNNRLDSFVIHHKQLSDLQKLCNVFAEALPQKETETETEEAREEKWSPLAWGAGALIVGLGAYALAKYFRDDPSIER
jgi:hypothetical protein